ncbi:MAG: (NiFe) hydrogenase maturation protein HypF [Herbinix sp.]|jgi:hydrogenase maturation protein HypF|nr:(NiFe) hydrogenase maturation protein HypF [Herbinix sp.]
MDNGQIKRITKRIKVFGIVQGVGFRPLVYRIAKKHNISGCVRNVGGFVEIVTHSLQEDFDSFLLELKTNKESCCEIIKLEIKDIIQFEDISQKDGLALISNMLEIERDDFIIIDSQASEEVSIIPPDLPVCQECQNELYEKRNRRFLNPFISCMSCGPRYSIIEELPYDRNNTTMRDFDLCKPCHEEYISPTSRRFHAQTISCNDCGPYLIYHDMQEERRMDISEEVVEQDALEEAVVAINSGDIIAVKGIGGYHFVCSPFKEATVQNLRKLKGREEKPFAVMFETLGSIEEYCIVSEEEKTLLESKARPIVLLYTKGNIMAPSTNKGSIYCGSFLPYTPLQILLTNKCGPLIMTSANIANKPIIKEDATILSLKVPYLKGVLYNKRRIVRSVDDSVAKIIDHKPQLIRRSRGYVPYPVFISGRPEDTPQVERNSSSLLPPSSKKNIMIFAAGGDLKSAYCLYKYGSAVVSQYFGDLEEVDIMKEYKASLTDLSRLLKITPSLAVCDMHPNYYSVDFAKTLGIPILQVQHHHAHIASVMAEYDLKERVIGVAFDGTGYGTDGNIWGGEFLVCEGADFIRAAHLGYIPILGGDQSMRDAKKTATCYLINSGLDEYSKDNRSEIIKAAINNKINTVLTSSMGRLFDAVASILNLGQDNRYEGECAASLEREAVLALRNDLQPEYLAFAIQVKSEIITIDPKPILETICHLRETIDPGSLALGFHYAVADMIGEVCEMIRRKQNSNTVAISGGVFQNTILTERTLKILREKRFQVYVNMAVPPNDGSISLGQTYIGLMK